MKGMKDRATRNVVKALESCEDPDEGGEGDEQCLSAAEHHAVPGVERLVAHMERERDDRACDSTECRWSRG